MVWNLNNCKEHDRFHRILCSTKVKVVHFSDMRKQMFVFFSGYVPSFNYFSFKMSSNFSNSSLY